jgi:hypothetical protein
VCGAALEVQLPAVAGDRPLHDLEVPRDRGDAHVALIFSTMYSRVP